MSLSREEIIQKWLHCSAEELITLAQIPADDDPEPEAVFLKKFLNLGIPIIYKCNTIFMGEIGDIEICLKIILDHHKSFNVNICHLDEKDNELTVVQTACDTVALQLLKAFVIHFPGAIFTTENRKPVMFFIQKEDPEKPPLGDSPPNPKIPASLGQPVGYMNLINFKKIIEDGNANKLRIAVP